MVEINLQVLFEDDDLLAVAKPFGVVVNRSESYKFPTVQDWMSEYFKKNPPMGREGWQNLLPEDFNPEYGTSQEVFTERIGMVHRLDKDTSGILLLAKNPGSLANLLSQFRNRTVVKEYVCLTHGKFAMESGTISLPIARRQDDRKKFGVVPEGRPAVTNYQVEKFFPDFRSEQLDQTSGELRLGLYQGFSLVKCQPKTGRTHQIRVHLQHLQHPIVGDYTYVGKKRAKIDSLWCPRQFLHASKITFSHPRTNKNLTVDAPLPEDLSLVLRFVV